GFITVKDGILTKGASAVRTPEDWLDHVRAVLDAVSKTYPEICPSTPKVYRLAILTHGHATSGLRFVNAANPEADDVWLRKKNLAEPDGKAFLDGIATCLATS